MDKHYSLKSLDGKLILFASVLASGLAFFSFSAVGIAVPTIQAYFNTNLAGIQWIVNSSTLVMAVFILISGSLGDIFGRKKIFVYGISLFTLGSFLSGLSMGVGQLIFYRIIQGLGAAMMVPGSLAIINVCFKEREKGKVIGLWAGFSGGIAALGPFIGGWLITAISWQAVFYSMIPFGLITLFVAIKYVPESRNPSVKHVDWLGTLFLGISLTLISVALIQGPISGWTNNFILGSFVLGAISMVIFYYIEKKVRSPIVNFSIFKNPIVTGANITTLLLYFALNGLIFFYILNVQQIQGYSPAIAGLSLLPPILFITFLSGPAGSLADRIGSRKQMIFGPLIVAVGMALLIIPGTDANYFIHFLPGLSLFGLGMALVIAPLTKSALMVEPKFSGVASGVNNAASRGAALVAVAVLGGVILAIFSSNLASGIESSSLDQAQKTQILEQTNKLGGIIIPANFDSNSRDITKGVINNSFVSGFRWIMGISALLAILSAFISFITIKSPKSTG